MAANSAPSDKRLVLDNDVFTDWRKRRPHTVLAVNDYQLQFKELPKLTSVTVFEALWGIESRIVKPKAPNEPIEQWRLEVEQLIQSCGVLEFNRGAAEIAAYIFARLSHSQRNQHWRDVFIAATALAHDHGVATRNKDDFELVGRDLPTHAPTLHLAIWKS